MTKNTQVQQPAAAKWALLGSLMLMPLWALAADPVAPKIALNSGDTAWMLTATALVLFMTIPGLALFYAGMVRSKNVLSVMMQCFAITAMVSIIWLLGGYAIAYGGDGPFFGAKEFFFLDGLPTYGDAKNLSTRAYPDTVHVMFQMTFAIITPALIVGAFAERMKFSAMLIFMLAWILLVYAPVAHWVWGNGGWLRTKGVIDLAGGTVVHISAGVAGLVAAIMLGRRKGYPTTMMPPHNLGYTLIGASMLWIGWFGFNAGSAEGANELAGSAMLVTQIAAAAAALSWMFMEWMHHGKPSVLGIASGAVAGLVAITPASGAVGPMGALALGATAGVGCFYATAKLKKLFGYDDSLDVFGVHAVGGIIGAILAGVFCSPALGVFKGSGFGKASVVDAANKTTETPITSIGEQVSVQLLSIGAVILYTLVATFVILLVIRVIMGLRVTEDQENEGLDIALHDERGYNL